MDKVYIVTSGEYSDYHIVAVFSDRKQAEFCAAKEGDYCVEIEEWDLDPVKFEGTIWYKYNCRVEQGVVSKKCVVATLNKDDNWVHQGLDSDWEGNKIIRYYDVCIYLDRSFDFTDSDDCKAFDKIIFDYIAKDKAEKNEAWGITQKGE